MRSDKAAASERAFTLVELLISLSIGLMLIAGLLSLVRQTATAGLFIDQRTEWSHGIYPLPTLFAAWLPPARSTSSKGVQGFELTENGCRIRSDFDGDGGFPDGALASPFEDIALRADRRGLSLKSGRGRFQSIASQVIAIDLARPSRSLVTMRLQLARRWRAGSGNDPLGLAIALPNYRRHWFEDE